MILATCGDLITSDHVDMCNYLNEQIRQVRIQPWISAGITGAVGILAAALTAWLTFLGTSKSGKTERFNAAQRQALMDTQDAGVNLRSRLIEWGEYLDAKALLAEAASASAEDPAAPAASPDRARGAQKLLRRTRPPEVETPIRTEPLKDPFPPHDQETVIGKLKAHLSRINKVEVGQAFSDWATYAQLTYSHSEDHNLSEEIRLWQHAMESAGKEQRRLDE